MDIYVRLPTCFSGSDIVYAENKSIGFWSCLARLVHDIPMLRALLHSSFCLQPSPRELLQLKLVNGMSDSISLVRGGKEGNSNPPPGLAPK